MFEICLKLSEPAYVYADQIAIVTRSRSDQLQTRYLQEIMAALEKWCKNELNAKKIQAIVFKKKKVRTTRHPTVG